MHNAHLFERVKKKKNTNQHTKHTPPKKKKTPKHNKTKKTNKKLAPRGKEQVTVYQTIISSVYFTFSQNKARHSHSIQKLLNSNFISNWGK